MRWFAYYQIEPWGEERADLRIGVLDSIVLGAFGQKAKPSDFVFSGAERAKAPPRKSEAEMEALLSTISKFTNAIKRVK